MIIPRRRGDTETFSREGSEGARNKRIEQESRKKQGGGTKAEAWKRNRQDTSLTTGEGRERKQKERDKTREQGWRE